MVLAFGHRALLGQGTKCPPCQVRSAGRVAWRGSLRCGLGGTVLVSNLLGVHLRAHLCPRVPGLKLPEQCFLVGLRLDVSGGWVLLQECLKALSLYRFDAVFVEPLLRER